MAHTAEQGNFEGRSRASGGFGNESGQTDRRGRSGEAERANRDAPNRGTARSAPQGPFKSPVYEATWQNLAQLGRMVGPMIAAPEIGLAAPVAQSMLSGNPYGAFGRPSGWSSYSQRDINPTGGNPRGNIGGRDNAIGNALIQARRNALLEEARRREATRPTISPHPIVPFQQYAPRAIFDHGAGLSTYGIAGSGSATPMPGRKAGGYGGVARPSPIAFSDSHL